MRNRPGRCPGAAGSATPGFTLIELLVVIAIIAVLIAVLMPGLARSRESARSAVCLTRLHNLHVGVRVYADDYRTMPVQAVNAAITDLELPHKVWRCPSDRAGQEATAETYSSYQYLAPIYMDPPSGVMTLSLLKPWVAYRKYENNPRLPLFWDTDTWHERERNVVYWDGSARRKDW